MSFEVRIKKKALKFISTLSKEEREKLKEAFLVLNFDLCQLSSWILQNCGRKKQF